MVKLVADYDQGAALSLSNSVESDAYLSTPPELWVPDNEENLLSEIAFKKSPIRITGPGGVVSSPLDSTTGTAISLERLSGSVNIDHALKTATFWAGTPLREVHHILKDHDLALISSPEDMNKTLGQAIAFADHGSGRLGCLSAYVKSIRLISPEGRLYECNASCNTSLFQAARVDLGVLGVISQITLYIRDNYRLKESINVLAFDDFLAALGDIKQASRHTEFWVFPWADEVVVRQLEETQEPLTELNSNWTTDDWFLKWLAWLNQYVPGDHLPWLKKLNWLVPRTQRVGWSHEIIPLSVICSSYAMEYAVSVKQSQSLVLELMQVLRTKRRVPLSALHLRWVARDDIWLSPFSGGDTLSIGLMSGGESETLLNDVEQVLMAYQGRPSWSIPRCEGDRRYADIYPKWADFTMIRQSLDPNNKMINSYLRRLFIDPATKKNAD